MLVCFFRGIHRARREILSSPPRVNVHASKHRMCEMRSSRNISTELDCALIAIVNDWIPFVTKGKAVNIAASHATDSHENSLEAAFANSRKPELGNNDSRDSLDS